MSKVEEVSIELKDSTISKCSLMIAEREPWNLSITGECLEHSAIDGIVISESDLFESLLQIRKELEKSGMKLLCNGARKDVWPSPMSRSMGGGKKAYLMETGKSATELVCIFDYAEPHLVGTVSEQREFYNQWIESLGRE